MRFFNRQGRFLLLVMVLTVGMVCWLGCGDENPGAESGAGSWLDSGTSPDGGVTYETVMIGSQKWMKKNLNIETEGSWCYNDSLVSCETHGRLYTWEAAMTACPRGWHLPDTSDWNKLIEVAGGVSAAGKVLKSASGWTNQSNGEDGNGTDSLGFSALPGGARSTDGSFYFSDSPNKGGFWWTATDAPRTNTYYAYYRAMYTQSDDMIKSVSVQNSAYSVRCLEGSNNSTTIPVRTTYEVKVLSPGSGAKGDGRYSKGVKVYISAGTVSSDSVFDKWTTASLNVNINAADSVTTWFTMPENDVMVTAEFNPVNSGRDSILVYGNQIYRTVVIGNKRWMAENLNILITGTSWCYDNAETNCVKYGRLYNWEAAKMVCPKGWKLPDTADWRALVKIAGGREIAGKLLKSNKGWNGTNDYGFSALPGGRLRGGEGGQFVYVGYGPDGLGNWWTATETSERGSVAYIRGIATDGNYIFEYDNEKRDGISVRCLEDR